jgi:hypothetical protein
LITFTASGGSVYNWSCTGTGFSCPGSGANQTTPTTAGNYSAQVRFVQSAGGVTCYSDWSSSGGTVVANPAVPQSISVTGPECEGKAVVFTAQGCTGACDWSCSGIGSSFSCSGSGAYKDSPTTPGTYTASVRSVSGGCYSNVKSVTGYVRAKAKEGDTKHDCGCQSTLVECGNKCTSTCSASSNVACNGTYRISTSLFAPDACAAACAAAGYSFYYMKIGASGYPAVGYRYCYCCNGS